MAGLKRLELRRALGADLAAHVVDEAVDRAGEGGVVCDHEPVGGHLHQREMQHPIALRLLLLGLGVEHAVQVALQRLPALFVRVSDGQHERLPLHGIAKLADLLVAQVIQRVHDRQHLLERLVKMRGNVISAALTALHHAHDLQQADALAHGGAADVQELRQLALGRETVIHPELPGENPRLYIFNYLFGGFFVRIHSRNSIPFPSAVVQIRENLVNQS